MQDSSASLWLDQNMMGGEGKRGMEINNLFLVTKASSGKEEASNCDRTGEECN